MVVAFENRWSSIHGPRREDTSWGRGRFVLGEHRVLDVDQQRRQRNRLKAESQ